METHLKGSSGRSNPLAGGELLGCLLRRGAGDEADMPPAGREASGDENSEGMEGTTT